MTRSSALRTAAPWILLAAVTMAAGCAAPERRAEEPAGPGVAAAPPPAVRPPAAALPPSRPPEGRPVRVRIETPGAEVALSGERIRAWGPDGMLVADEAGPVRVRALGDRILWSPAGAGAEGPRGARPAAAPGTDEKTGRVLPSAIDIGGSPDLGVGRTKLPGRARIGAAGGKLQVVAVLPVEEYVAAVVSREASPSFAPEALAACAVAARTYVLRAMAKPRDPAYDLTSGVEDQVFDGIGGAGAPFRAAAEATRGKVLLDGNGLAQAFYHSTCGGATESAAAAWGRDVPYLRSVPCDDCSGSPAWRWTYRMSAAEARRVALALGIRAEKDLTMEIVGLTASGRARRIRLSSGGVSREIAAAGFRRAAGYDKVKSLKMRIVPTAGGWTFSGQGYGHGVGMCQWGAEGMARRGKGHREILARYFPGTRLGEGPN